MEINTEKKLSHSWLDPATEFEELYKAEYEPLFRKLRTMVSDEVLAKDLTQQTFEKAFRNRFKYKPNAPPAAWLWRIGHNLAVSYIRHQTVVRKISNKYREDISMEQQFFKGETRAILGRAMRFLSKEQREVINLHYYKDMSDVKIAKHLGIPTATARSRRRTALENMRKQLGLDSEQRDLI